MNLVESENWTLYDYKAVCVPDTLVATWPRRTAIIS